MVEEARSSYEVVIVGAGIAGSALAYWLAVNGVGDVLILERESEPGYHATGRSAAAIVEMDPTPSVLDLTIEGGRFLRRPPPEFCELPLVTETGVMILYRQPLFDLARELLPALADSGVEVDLPDKDAVLARVPALAPDSFDAAMELVRGGRLDVNELLMGYLRHARRAGAQLICGAEVDEVIVEDGRCVGVRTAKGPVAARWVVNAAGAWVGRVGEMAGAVPIPFQPKRRTIATFGAPDALDVADWPFVAHFENQLYFAPEAGGLMASPMDEDPVEPCDARPQEIVVAQMIDRLHAQVPGIAPRSIRSAWSGLRTFSPDSAFVIGEDSIVRGFFWLAGMQGAGIETSPAYGRVAADLLLTGSSDYAGVAQLSPDRFG